MNVGPTPAGLVIPPALSDELEACYREPPRHYHTFAHALAVASRVLEAHAEGGLVHVREAYVAALFHDAVYDVARTDNETRSAELARSAIARFHLEADPELVVSFILRTAEHGRAASLTPDEALFLDCDIATLGGGPEAYDAYEAGVAAEYRTVVPEELYRAGRRRFLESLAASPRLFASPYFEARLERPARANLARALART